MKSRRASDRSNKSKDDNPVVSKRRDRRIVKDSKIVLAEEDSTDEDDYENEKLEISIEDDEIVKKPGRAPYNPNILRKPLDGNETEAPPGYQSIQKYINSGPDCTIDESHLNKYLKKLQKRGFLKCSVEEIFFVPNGSRISYITTENKYRSGGFLVSINKSTENWDEENGLVEKKKQDDDDNNVNIFIMYKAFNGSVFSLQLEDVHCFFVKIYNKNKKQSKRPVKVIFKRPDFQTSFPVYLENSEGKQVVVYYARDNYTMNRFKNSKKFENALNSGWEFDDGTDFD